MTPWMRCGACGKIVRVNKPLFGSMHVCVTAEEYAYRLQVERAIRQQMQAQQIAKRRRA